MQKEIGKDIFFNLRREEIGRFKLTDYQTLVASFVGEKLDLRIWVDGGGYKGWTKQGLRFYLFDENWEEFKELVDKVDEAFEEKCLTQGGAYPIFKTAKSGIVDSQYATTFQNSR